MEKRYLPEDEETADKDHRFIKLSSQIIRGLLNIDDLNEEELEILDLGCKARRERANREQVEKEKAAAVVAKVMAGPPVPSSPAAQSGLALFNSSEFSDIRKVMEDGKPLFCAKDVAVALGYENFRDAIGRHCKGVVKRDLFTSTGKKGLSFIPESDVFRLIMRSKLPGAVRFQDWVVEEVLPTIRKTGRFEIAPAPPQTYADALRIHLSQVKQNEARALENTEHRRT